jgi:hypothetical protein
MKKYPGGGYPEKVDQMVERLCKEKRATKPKYLQVQGNDVEILKVACRSGKMPSITYCWSPTGRYRGTVAHMVNLVHVDNKWWGILDNNFPENIEWMNETEFKRAYLGKGGGWAVILLNPGPPPMPTN